MQNKHRVTKAQWRNWNCMTVSGPVCGRRLLTSRWQHTDWTVVNAHIGLHPFQNWNQITYLRRLHQFANTPWSLYLHRSQTLYTTLNLTHYSFMQDTKNSGLNRSSLKCLDPGPKEGKPRCVNIAELGWWRGPSRCNIKRVGCWSAMCFIQIFKKACGLCVFFILATAEAVLFPTKGFCQT